MRRFLKGFRKALMDFRYAVKHNLVPLDFWISLYSFIVGNIALILVLIRLVAKLRG